MKGDWSLVSKKSVAERKLEKWVGQSVEDLESLDKMVWQQL